MLQLFEREFIFFLYNNNCAYIFAKMICYQVFKNMFVIIVLFSIIVCKVCIINCKNTIKSIRFYA